MSDNRQYRIIMDSLTAIQIMTILDEAACQADDGVERDAIIDINNQLDKEHTMFLNTIGTETKTETKADRKSIDDTIEEILYDRFLTGIANKIVLENERRGRSILPLIVGRVADITKERQAARVAAQATPITDEYGRTGE